jgi:hypothetical protein
LAGRAAEDIDAAGFGAATADGVDNLLVIFRDVGLKRGQVFRTELPEDLSDGSHIQSLA